MHENKDFFELVPRFEKIFFLVHIPGEVNPISNASISTIQSLNSNNVKKENGKHVWINKKFDIIFKCNLDQFF